MRSGITHTNGNEIRKVDEDQNMNIATTITYQIINQMINWNIYVNDDYAIKPRSPKPFFIRAAELFGQMDIDGRKVEKTPDYIRTPCMVHRRW
jgi:hypothetical protein